MSGMLYVKIIVVVVCCVLYVFILLLAVDLAVSRKKSCTLIVCSVVSQSP